MIFESTITATSEIDDMNSTQRLPLCNSNFLGRFPLLLSPKRAKHQPYGFISLKALNFISTLMHYVNQIVAK